MSLLCWFDHFLDSGAEIFQIFRDLYIHVFFFSFAVSFSSTYFIFYKKNEKFDKFLPQNLKSGQINKVKTLSYNITIIIWAIWCIKDTTWWHYFTILPLFRFWGRNLSNFSLFFGKFKKSKRHSVIIWPLLGHSTFPDLIEIKLLLSSPFFQEGISALMLGTANNRLNCVKILLQEGADPELKSKVWSYFFFYITFQPRNSIVREHP